MNYRVLRVVPASAVDRGGPAYEVEGVSGTGFATGFVALDALRRGRKQCCWEPEC